MIDLHCHLLPAVDDGSRSMEQSLQLARTAVDDGIRHSVMTPHIHVGRYRNMRSNLLNALNEFQQALLEAEIPLSISLGGEVRLGIEILQLLKENEIPMLGELDGYKIMLLEFPHNHIFPGAEKLIDALLVKNIRPLIAHPERNKEVMRSIDKIYPFVQRGCLLQLTAGSLVGNFGPAAKHTALALLEKSWVSVLASDAHNSKHRPPVMSAGRDTVEKLYGSEMAQELVIGTPQKIIGNLF